MAGKTRQRIEAKPVLETVEEVPAVTRVAASKLYDDLVQSILDAGKPGSWFRVFKGLPTSSAANSRAGSIKSYENMEAVGRREGDSYSVFARSVTQAILDKEAKDASK